MRRLLAPVPCDEGLLHTASDLAIASSTLAGAGVLPILTSGGSRRPCSLRLMLGALLKNKTWDAQAQVQQLLAWLKDASRRTRQNADVKPTSRPPRIRCAAALLHPLVTQVTSVCRQLLHNGQQIAFMNTAWRVKTNGPVKAYETDDDVSAGFTRRNLVKALRGRGKEASLQCVTVSNGPPPLAAAAAAVLMLNQQI